jgi:hypothetical protein
MKLSKPLLWEDVANEYTKLFGGRPYIMPMDKVFDRLANHENFHVSEDGSIHKILNK